MKATRKGTKAERTVRAQKSAAKRRVAVALAKFLKQANPGRKVPVNVRVKRLKGGGFSITPVKANPSRKRKLKTWAVYSHSGFKGHVYGHTKKEAMSEARDRWGDYSGLRVRVADVRD